MFEDFGLKNPPRPPAGALEKAMNRGRKLRRQRHSRVVSAVALSAALIGGITLTDPFHSDQALVAPAEQPAAPRDYSPIPVRPALTPATKTGLDFGILTKITTASGVVTLHVDRSNFYQGKDVADHTDDRTRDWVIEDTDGEGKELTFTLDPKASIQAEAHLRNDHDAGNQRETLTPAQLITNLKYVTTQNAAQTDPDAKLAVLIWFRHADGGPVTALADQFTP
jgi:hypothetical protein